MRNEKKILVVDDEVINRLTLSNILSNEYMILEAENGKVALDTYQRESEHIVAILLDLIMPEMDGLTFLENFRKIPGYQNVPIIVVSVDDKSEQECLRLGVWDFVMKPYSKDIIRFRVKNAIERSRLQKSERDSLTGLYTKIKFFQKTKDMLQHFPEKKFVFIRFDIDRFNMINAFYGNDEGDRFLKYIAAGIVKFCSDYDITTYGRIEVDVFCICISLEKIVDQALDIEIGDYLQKFNTNFSIKPSIGIYEIEDNEMDISIMYDKAFLASKKCKGKYDVNYAFYDRGMSKKIMEEQEIVNEMAQALEEEQFVVYFQPKFDLVTTESFGAEALVRWNHPTKGMISPGVFIPIFEANGFVGKLDYYVWEKTCQYLRKWMDEGITPQPISVNLSRVDLYNPKIVESIIDLVEKYKIPVGMLNLELTESAFILNQEVIRDTMEKMQRFGFQVYMDDFGSGYSSLNVLKDIHVDVLKIDMKFLPTEESRGRSEMILTSVIRMAKWLDIPVIMEGVETEKQVSFLQSVGCDYVQGFYFARPMPAEEYESMQRVNEQKTQKLKELEPQETLKEFWRSDSKLNTAFTFFLQPVGIIEYAGGDIELIRTNPAFVQMMGYGEEMKGKNYLKKQRVIGDGWERIEEAFQVLSVNGGTSECEYTRISEDGQIMWLHVKLQLLGRNGQILMVLGIFNDITNQKKIEVELRKFRIGMEQMSPIKKPYLLIVDDVEMNRIILDGVFCDQYEILFAENGKQALDILAEKGGDIEIVLLDLLVPVMDGREFLIIKNQNQLLADIPVVVISTEDSKEIQINMLELGVNDYITKPFVSEIVKRRINNVLEFKTRFRSMVREYGEITTDN